jgi:hypothetical protein
LGAAAQVQHVEWRRWLVPGAKTRHGRAEKQPVGGNAFPFAHRTPFEIETRVADNVVATMRTRLVGLFSGLSSLKAAF